MKTLRKHTALYAFLFMTAAFCLLVVFMLRRDYTVHDASDKLFTVLDSLEAVPLTESGNAFERLALTESDAVSGQSFSFQIPESIRFEDLSFENHYPVHTLAIRIRTKDKDFARQLEITARNGLLEQALCSYDADACMLTLTFTSAGLMEFFPEYRCDTEATGFPNAPQAAHKIIVTCHSPEELYDKIIVIDPLSGVSSADTAAIDTDNKAGADSSYDAALTLAQEMQTQAAALGNGTRIYLTRTRQTALEKELILNLIHESGAVRYLALALPDTDVSLRASAYFNDRFFIRGYGNLKLAADAEQALSALDRITLTGVYPTQTSDQADGTAVLGQLKIPGTLLRIDGLSAASRTDETLLPRVAAALLSIF